MLDSLGEGRDQDVLTVKLLQMNEKNKYINSKEFLKILNAEKSETRQRIKLGLIKYICDENVNKFFKKNKLG